MKTSIFFACFFFYVSSFSYAQSTAFIDNTASVDKKASGKEVPLHLQFRQPEFPGGQEALSEYIQAHLEYPALAERHGREGAVVVRFQLDETGKISGVTAENAIGMGCEEAAVALVRNMPNWKPAMQGGRYIPASMRVPVQFRLY